ncbi:MAG: tetratricopeptide repeat protein [Planctomycetia bacterium]|nr:tetratricopeptide repeat protein [Planctomycetia bacterium]
MNVNPNIGAGARGNVGANVGPGARANVGPGARANIGAGGRANVGAGSRAGIMGGTGGTAAANRSLGGNQINVGSRAINLAGTNYSPSFNNHPGIYNGYWGGNWGGTWGGGWGGPFGYGFGGYGPYGYGYGGYGWGGGYWGRPFGWGLAGWGLGALLYNSGYLGYYNPYWGGGYGGYGGYNYAQPIPVDYGNSYAVATSSGTSVDDMLNAAIAAFRQGDYDTALDISNQAISQYPSDAVFHEFRALVLFAKGDFRQAAATLHSVLAIGPGWDWTTMARMYPDIAIYTAQLRALEGATRQNPDDASARFLLAYHYTTAGHADAAAAQLERVVQLVPEDRVAADLLRMLRPPANAPATSPGQSPTPQPPVENPNVGPTNPPVTDTPQNAPTIDPNMLIGSWKASRDDGSSFSLQLTNDQKFNWKFTSPQQKVQELSGTYTVEKNVLALQQQGGGALVGTVTPQADGVFNFKMLGGPKEDPGLNFTR